MQTITTPAAIEQTAAINTRAAYLALREEWREKARNKANSAWDFIHYTIKRAELLSEKLGKDEAEAWALTKLREAFTPSKNHGRWTLERLLYSIRHRSSETERYRQIASFAYDEIRTEA